MIRILVVILALLIVRLIYNWIKALPPTGKPDTSDIHKDEDSNHHEH